MFRKTRLTTLTNKYFPNVNQESHFSGDTKRTSNNPNQYYLNMGQDGHKMIQDLIYKDKKELQKMLNDSTSRKTFDSVFVKFSIDFLTDNTLIGVEKTSIDFKKRVDIISYNKQERLINLFEIKVSNINNVLRKSHYDQVLSYLNEIPRKHQHLFDIKLVLISTTKNEYKIYNLNKIKEVYLKNERSKRV